MDAVAGMSLIAVMVFRILTLPTGCHYLNHQRRIEMKARIYITDTNGEPIPCSQVRFVKDRYSRDEDGCLHVAVDTLADINDFCHPIITDSGGVSQVFCIDIKELK
jgi:hypothetical protein